MRSIVLPLLVASLLVGGCASMPDGAGTGEVAVGLAAAQPVAGEVEAAAEHRPDQLVVAFSRVGLVPADDGEIVELDLAGELDLMEVDLLELGPDAVGDFAALHAVPAGAYAQVRLIVASATIHFGDDAFDVFVPSGAQSGLKIGIDPPLTVEDGAEYELTVSFDVDRAVVEAPPGSGRFILKPTAIRVWNATEGAELD
jgi:hypothetical protein